MWKTIYDTLKENNLNPHPPAKHVGDCKENYCVVLDGQQIRYANHKSAGIKIYDIILFVPYASYVEMESYKNQVRSALKNIQGLEYTGFETPTIQDDDKKAYTASIEYRVNKRIGGKCII